MDRSELRARARERAAACARPVSVACAAWDCDVFIRQLTWPQAIAVGEEFNRADSEDEGKDAPAIAAARERRLARMIAMRLCDADGTLLFEPEDDADLAEVLAQPAAFLAEMRTHIEAVDRGKPSTPTASS